MADLTYSAQSRDPAAEAKFEDVRRYLQVEPFIFVGGTGGPAFTNGWVNFGGGYPPAGFYRDRSRVYLTGLVKSGTVGLSMFLLPAGYRPVETGLSQALLFAVTTNPNVTTELRVDVGGNVWTPGGAASNVYVSLNGVSFRYE